MSVDAAQVQFGRFQHRALQAALTTATGATRISLVIEGVRVPVLRLGRGRPLLIVHGFGDRGESMLPLAALLHRQFAIVIPDLPGFGEADAVPSERTTIPAQARFLTQLLDALGISRVHVCGQSMGGAIAARLAHEYPQRVQSVTLLAAAGPRGLHPHVELMLQAGRNPLLPRDVDGFIELLSISFSRPPPFSRSLLRFLAEQWMARREEHVGHFALLSNHQAEAWMPEIAPKVSMPARVVYGRDERLVHLDNRDLYARVLTGGRSILLDRVGHLPHLEAPLAVAKILREVAAEADAFAPTAADSLR